MAQRARPVEMALAGGWHGGTGANRGSPCPRPLGVASAVSVMRLKARRAFDRTSRLTMMRLAVGRCLLAEVASVWSACGAIPRLGAGEAIDAGCLPLCTPWDGVALRAR